MRWGRNRHIMPSIRRWVLLAAALSLVALCACSVKPAGEKEMISADYGQVFVYLSGGREVADAAFTLAGMSFINRDGVRHEVTPEVVSIRSGKSEDSQIRLGIFHLPSGSYDILQWRVWVPEGASAAGSGNDRPLSPAANAENSITVSTSINLRVERGGSQCLFVRWGLMPGVENATRMRPRFSATGQQLEISRLLAYVTNTGSDCVTVIDKQADRVVGTIGVGKAPRGIALNKDGSVLYVANSGSNDISVIDTGANRVVRTIGTYVESPVELALSRDDRVLFASAPDAGMVLAIDSYAGVISNRIRVGRNPMAIVADDDHRKIYAANSDSMSVSVIDMDAPVVLSTIRLNGKPGSMALCGDRLFIGDSGQRALMAMEIPSYVVKPIYTGFVPGGIACGLSDRVYVGNLTRHEIAFFHRKVGTVTRQIPVGTDPAALAVDDAVKKIYAINTGSDDVSVIDITGQKRIKTLQVGKHPHGIVTVNQSRS